MFLIPNGLIELPEMHFKLPFNLIGKLTVALLTGQSWDVLKFWYTRGTQNKDVGTVSQTDRGNQKFSSICGTG